MSPLLALTALLVRIKMGSPFIFTQTRAGLHAKSFDIYKFRTMTDARDTVGRLLPDPQRLTPLGRFLRSTSIDELPQLFNVLKGDLSLIGPRALPVKYIPRYNSEQMRRHEVKPGVAGYAATFGRSDQCWESIFAHDVWYVDHVSPWLDLVTLVKVLLVVFKREGVAISADGMVPEFMGSQQHIEFTGDVANTNQKAKREGDMQE